MTFIATPVRRLAVVLATTATVSALAFSPALASGGGGGGNGSSGPCSTISLWSLQAKIGGKGLEVRADVFSNELNSTWKWQLFDNGQRIAKGTGVMDKERRDWTYFEVRRSIPDQQGTDDIRFVAAQTITGEVCDGSLPV